MSKEIISLTGYHGTKKYLKSSIEVEGFRKSLSGWLGEGVYFFQDDYQMAVNWAKKKYNTMMTCFIKRRIVVENDLFFDITWPLAESTKYFFEEKEKYIKYMEKKGYKIEVTDKKRFEGEVIDLICREKKYAVVRACTYTYQKHDEIYKLNSIFANGVEVCVKDSIYLKKGED